MALNLGELVAFLSIDPSGVDEGAEKGESRLKSFAANAAKITAGAAVAAGGAFVATLNSAMNLEATTDRVAASLDLTQKQAESMSAAVRKTFANNYGESEEEVADATESMIASFANLKNASSKTLSDMTGMAFDFAGTFNQDIGDSITTAGALVKNGLAKDATEGFDMMTAGMQKVPVAMRDEFGPLLQEYAPQLKNLGIDGADAIQMMVDSASAGPWGMDKTFDAMKELGVLATGQDKNQRAALKSMGIDYKAFTAGIQSGGKDMQDTTAKLAESLLSIEDPVKRNSMALAAFGAPFEEVSKDQIPGLLKTLAGTGKGLGDFHGKTAEAGKKLNDNAKAIWGGMTRSVKMYAVGLATKLLPTINKGMHWLADNAVPALKKVGKVIRADVLPIVARAAGAFRDKLMPPIKRLIAGVRDDLVPALLSFWDAYKADIADALSTAFEAAGAAVGTLYDAYTKVIPVLSTVIGWMAENKDIVYGVLAALAAYKIAMMVQAGVTIAMTAAQTALNISMSLNPIGIVVLAIVALVAAFIILYRRSDKFRSLVHALWGGMKKFGSWVAGVFVGAVHGIGKAFTWVKGKVSAVWGWVKGHWPLLLAILTGPIGLAVLAIAKNWDKIRAGAAAVKDGIVRKFDGLVTFFTGMPAKMKAAVTGLWDGLGDGFTGVINSIIEKWNSLSFGIPEVNTHIKGIGKVGGFSLDTPNIPLLAKGGVTTGPTLAMIGEEVGKPHEAVLPLDRLASMLDREYAAGAVRGGVSDNKPSKVFIALDAEGRETLTGYMHKAAGAVVDAGAAWTTSRTRAGAFA